MAKSNENTESNSILRIYFSSKPRARASHKSDLYLPENAGDAFCSMDVKQWLLRGSEPHTSRYEPRPVDVSVQRAPHLRKWFVSIG